MRKLSLFKILAVTIMIFAVSPCFGAGDKTIKIGSVNSLTGWMAAGENPTNEGMQLAVDWINDNGGITVKGVTYKLQLISADSKSSPEGMMAACTKLVEADKVKFILGGTNPVMNIAASSVTEPAGVLRLASYMCANPQEAGPQNPLTFFANNVVQSMRPVLTYLKETHPEVKKLALSHPGDGGGNNRRLQLEPIAKKLGFSIVYSEEWPGETVDFTPVMKKLLASKPDAIVFTDGWAYHAGAQIKAARSLDFKGPIVATNPEVVSEVLPITGAEAGEGHFAAAWDMLDPAMKPIMKKEIIPRASSKIGQLNNWQPFGWNTVWILAQAIESAQSLDPKVVAEHLRTMKSVDTIFGPATIGGEKTFGIKCLVCAPQAIFIAKGGKSVFVKWVDTNTP
ncbi:MAG: ABC transporter substrate-binding protein [Deltaproteobacteria bacterium]|nr:ABC transporter substrate-binding protein [Deltaproteobacteria bacterium]